MTVRKNSSSTMKLSWHVMTSNCATRLPYRVFPQNDAGCTHQIEYDGLTGYGEASLPPYLGETQLRLLNF